MSRLNGTHRIAALGQDWTLCFDFNALAEFEEATGRIALETIAEIEADPDRARISVMRALIWAGLLRHHPKVTLMQAGDIMAAAPDALIAGLNAALPDQADIAETDQPGKPQGRPPSPSG